MGWRYWSQARAVTLGLFLIVYDSFYHWFVTEFEFSAWHNPNIAIFISIVVAIILVVPWVQKQMAANLPDQPMTSS